jgi:hypothetical protein
MTYLYKLTDAAGYTQRDEEHETLWTPGEWREVKWGGALCRAGCLHAYRDPLLAVLLDPVHACFLPSGRLWVAEGDVRAEDPTKVGCSRLRVLREHDVPDISKAAKIRWAIYCASAVYREPQWLQWAERWLGGSDRSRQSAWVVAADAAAAYAAYAAADAAAYAAADADVAAEKTWQRLRLAQYALGEAP